MSPAIALLLDRWLGEPPSAFHPVVWMGRMIALLERKALRRDERRPVPELLGGIGIVAAVSGASLGATLALSRLLRPYPWLWLVAEAAVLKCMLSLHMLGDCAQHVAAALESGDLEAARGGLRSLCSRDASDLQPHEVAGAAIESVAENLSDSVVAPLFYFAVGGLPGAVLYRAVNTMDAMIGYHGRHEHVGKVAARLDDLLNLVPARLTALLLVAAATTGRADGVRVLLRDGGSTESPNAGRPMAAMSGLLGICLAKRGHYALGADLAQPRPADIGRAWRLARRAALLAAGLGVLRACL